MGMGRAPFLQRASRRALRTQATMAFRISLAAPTASRGQCVQKRYHRRTLCSMLDEPLGAKGRSMPTIQGLSKAAGNYRQADNPKFSCHECKFMFPRLAVGGCRYV